MQGRPLHRPSQAGLDPQCGARRVSHESCARHCQLASSANEALLRQGFRISLAAASAVHPTRFVSLICLQLCQPDPRCAGKLAAPFEGAPEKLMQRNFGSGGPGLRPWQVCFVTSMHAHQLTLQS